jgi:hypothetical protein
MGQINLSKFDHNNRMITLSVITLSGFHCITFVEFPFKLSKPHLTGLAKIDNKGKYYLTDIIIRDHIKQRLL